MGVGYRSRAERREIIKSIIAHTEPSPLGAYDLSPSELVFYRARTARALDELANSTGTFKAYYRLPAARPFFYVIGLTAIIVAMAVTFFVYLWLSNTDNTRPYALLSACVTVAVVAIGWVAAGWTSNRNTIRQNTNNMLFARFSHTAFGEAMHRFHSKFGNEISPQVTDEKIEYLRSLGDEESIKTATSVTYLLNYYEFIASGVIRGDLDAEIIKDNIRGLIIFYHDKCSPYITLHNASNPRVYENLIKIRTHYREV